LKPLELSETALNRRLMKSVVAGVMAFALFFHVHLGGWAALALSLEEERIAGEQFAASIRKHFDLVEDDFVVAYTNDLGHYLAQYLEIQHFPFHFYVLNDETLNAFAGPGGHVFIFSGLVIAMDRVDELAAVLCHEMGHVSARHISSRIEQNKKIALATLLGMLAGALIGGKAAGAIMTGSMAAGMQKQLSYSRNDERQADQLGFKYMEASGFDPAGMVDLLQRLERAQYVGPDAIPSYLLTHPGGSERIADTQMMLSELVPRPENPEIERYRKLFPFLKAILIAVSMAPQDAERLFKKDLEKNPQSATAHFGLGIVLKQRSEYAKAVEHLEMASAEAPGALPVLRHLGEAYQLQGQDRKAIRVFQRALEIDSLDKGALFLLALSHQNLEEYGEAIRIYERLTFMEPVRNEVFYNLGLCYGRQNKLALAHYYFGLYFKNLGELEKARFHFQTAGSFPGNDPVLSSRIQRAMKGVSSQ
jgi:predicted Zn-dependent protease